MEYLEYVKAGFLDELEKIAAKPKKENRRGWTVAHSRKKTRSMRVSTMLKKEKDGSLGGYKLAQYYGAATEFTDSTDRGAARSSVSKKPGAIPSREDIESQTPKREDGRESSATIHGPSIVMADIAPTNPGN